MGQAVSLGEIQETLLIPLYGRAQDAARHASILRDWRAVELVAEIDYDFAKFRGPALAGSVLRASIFDEYVREFLREHPDGTVVDLGCGLSTRFDRLDNGRVRWFDLDVADTMALRRTFFADRDRYTMISGSIFDADWHAQVATGGPIFLLSEAVLLYFPEAEVHALLRRLADVFPAAPLALDTGGAAMMNNQHRNPVFQTLAARMRWTCDDPAALERCGLTLRQSRTFATPQAAVGRTWPLRYRYGLKALGRTPPMTSYKVNLFTTGAR